MTVQVRLFAAARAAAEGVSVVSVEATSLAELRTVLIQRFGDGMQQVLDRCAFLVDGMTVRRGEDRPLDEGATVDVLPPFAGG